MLPKRERPGGEGRLSPCGGAAGRAGAPGGAGPLAVQLQSVSPFGLGSQPLQVEPQPTAVVQYPAALAPFRGGQDHLQASFLPGPPPVGRLTESRGTLLNGIGHGLRGAEPAAQPVVAQRQGLPKCRLAGIERGWGGPPPPP